MNQIQKHVDHTAVAIVAHGLAPGRQVIAPEYATNSVEVLDALELVAAVLVEGLVSDEGWLAAWDVPRERIACNRAVQLCCNISKAIQQS